MLSACLQRLPWTLACLLFATAATATITPSNKTDNPYYISGTVPLSHVKSDGQDQIAKLGPLTRAAAERTVGSTTRVLSCYSG
jgi:hypothetical protein